MESNSKINETCGPNKLSSGPDIVPGLSKAEVRDLVERASQMKEFSYSPYSKFRVGCALLSHTGRVFTGCNVENASYGLTNCAERVAFGKAVSEGCQKFRAIAVITDHEECVSPCGACRQTIREFGNHWTVICANNKGDYKIYTIDDILPDSFGPEKLEPF